jgi:hypothetical protein
MSRDNCETPPGNLDLYSGSRILCDMPRDFFAPTPEQQTSCPSMPQHLARDCRVAKPVATMPRFLFRQRMGLAMAETSTSVIDILLILFAIVIVLLGAWTFDPQLLVRGCNVPPVVAQDALGWD